MDQDLHCGFRRFLEAQHYTEALTFLAQHKAKFEAQKPGDLFYSWFDCRGSVAFLREAVEDLSSPEQHYRALLLSSKPSRPVQTAYAAWLVDQGRADEAICLIETIIAARNGDLYVESLLEKAHLMRSHGQSRGGMADPEVIRHKFCYNPFEHFEVVENGQVFACCPSLLPISLGNVFTDDITKIWTGPAAQAIRTSVLDGSFRYCSRLHCPSLLHGTQVNLPDLSRVPEAHKKITSNYPVRIIMNHDRTCNLSCPSCRREIIVAKGKEAERLAKIEDQMVDLVNNSLSSTITNSGDPFASKHFRSILQRLNPVDRENFTLALYTNANLLTPKEWENLSHLHDLKIRLAISIDAATPETYAVVRRRGDFVRLKENLSFIASLRADKKIENIRLCYVVQKKNWREMPDFVRWGKELGADDILFLRLWNFGSYTPEELQEEDVCSQLHPENAALQKMLNDPLFQDPIVNLGSIPRFGDDIKKNCA